MENGLEGKYIIRDNRKLRFGYTTGSCAAAAAKAAAQMLFSGQPVTETELATPKGIRLRLKTREIVCRQDRASCAVRKDAGDDPDVTDGILVFASARRCSRQEAEALAAVYESVRDAKPNGAARGSDCGVKPAETGQSPEERAQAVVGITAGEGIGTVTLPGLEQPVGAPAINRTPRRAIVREVQKICGQFGYTGGIEIRLWIPDGETIAKKTFNPRLGIEGGISVLGTSGIVEPMSEQALVDSIALEMRQKSVGGRNYLLVTPGNYGAEYLKGHFPFAAGEAVKCSNYVGQTIDLAVNMGLSGLLFVAHIGKFVKVGGGIMNTHSRDADARMEILASCALRAGADADLAREILRAATTDEGLRILKEAGLFEQALCDLTERVGAYLSHRAGDGLSVGAILFSNVYGELGRTGNAAELIEKLKEERGEQER